MQVLHLAYGYHTDSDMPFLHFAFALHHHADLAHEGILLHGLIIVKRADKVFYLPDFQYVFGYIIGF